MTFPNEIRALFEIELYWKVSKQFLEIFFSCCRCFCFVTFLMSWLVLWLVLATVLNRIIYLFCMGVDFFWHCFGEWGAQLAALLQFILYRFNSLLRSIGALSHVKWDQNRELASKRRVLARDLSSSTEFQPFKLKHAAFSFQ